MTRTPTADELLDALERIGRGPVRRRSSLEEFRSIEGRGVELGITSPDVAWWRYALAPEIGGDPKGTLDLAEQRALSKASGAAGAFTVPADLEAQVFAVVHSRGSVGRLAREIVTTTGSQLSVPVATVHGTAAWIGEAGAYSPSDETFDSVTLGAFKAGTSIIVSEELAADGLVEFDAWLAGELGARIVQLEGAAYVSGNGAGQAQGFLDNFTQLTAAVGSATTFTLDDLVEAVHAVAPDDRDQGGAWIASDAALKMLRTVRDDAGAPILLNATNPGEPPMLLGYPLYVDENMPAPAASAKSVAFAGWQAAYVIRRVAGVSVQRQLELYSASGQLGYRATHRVDGRVLNAAAGVTLVHSAT